MFMIAWETNKKQCNTSIGVVDTLTGIRNGYFPNSRTRLEHFRYIIVARMWRLYKTGIGLTTGFIGSHTITQLGYSVLHFTTHNN
jgi:hypothetical protein